MIAMIATIKVKISNLSVFTSYLEKLWGQYTTEKFKFWRFLYHRTIYRLYVRSIPWLRLDCEYMFFIIFFLLFISNLSGVWLFVTCWLVCSSVAIILNKNKLNISLNKRQWEYLCKGFTLAKDRSLKLLKLQILWTRIIRLTLNWPRIRSRGYPIHIYRTMM